MADFFRVVIGLCLLGCVAACSGRKEQPREFDLQPVAFYKIPGWASDDVTKALPALLKSCQNPKSDWREFCRGLNPQASSKKLRRYLEKNLDAYLVLANGSAEGTFTGYYEASLKGSFTREGAYQTPIYAMPTDLVRVDLKAFGVKSDKKQLIGRVENGKLVPYFKRIDSEQMQAPVLLWVDDPVDSFILHIQGSGRVETPDGVVHIGYAGNNGHGFVGIGSIMAKEGVLEPGKASMPHIRAWLRENPEQAKALMAQNPRFIFFQILPEADGPIGAAGVSLTPQRSIAVDARFVPLNTPVFLDTTDPDGEKIQQLVVAQDIGAAIKGPVRADFFWGYGEEAFQKAGRMKSVGRYYLLWPKGKTPPGSL